MSLTGKGLDETYKDVAYVDNSNNGVTTSLKQVKTGSGGSTALQVSDRSLQVKSATNNTTALDVQNASGTSKLLVDTTNNYVKANGVHIHTNYAYFGLNNVYTQNNAAGYHYPLVFGNAYPNTSGIGDQFPNFGNGTDPSTSFTFAEATDQRASEFVPYLWYVPDNISIDSVHSLEGADAATGDTTRAHLMGYDVVTTAGSTSGDLSNGVVLADGADVTNAGYEQAYYQQLTIQSANVDAGKAIFFTFRSDSVNSDFTINATVKYHLR